MAPVIRALKGDSFFAVRICVTAQHREMLDSVLKSFCIIPDYDLSLMKPEQSLSYITEAALRGIDEVIKDLAPDTVIVHGDTSSAFAGALCAFYNRIPVAHVEAGLRSNDIYSPFPEEFNRKAISMIASYHFAPTQSALESLLSEGVDTNSIFLVGNTVIDALGLSSGIDSKRELPPHPYMLMTLHRREHSDADVCSVFRAVRRICIEHPSLYTVYPMHKSPRFARLFSQILGDVKNIVVTEPLEVVDFHRLLRSCHLVLSDSGGIQEEAAYLGKPVLVTRKNTERPEGVSSGTIRVIGTDEQTVYENIKRLLCDKSEYDRASARCMDFGDGNASAKIAEILKTV